MCASFRQACLLLFLSILRFGASKQFDQLQGVRLKACALLEMPYIVRDTRFRSGLSGIAIDYLRLLQDDLGFALDLAPCDNSVTWNAFIERMGNCSAHPSPTRAHHDDCAVQLGVGPFTVSDERMRHVIFLDAFDHTSLQVVTLNEYLAPDKGNSLWFIYYPFSLTTWLCIVAGMVMHAVGAFFFPPFWDPDEVDGDEAHCESSDCFADAADETAPSFADTVSNYGGRAKRATRTFLCSMAQTYAAYLGSPMQAVADSELVSDPLSVAYLLLGVSSGLLVINFYQSSLSVLTFNAEYSSAFGSIDDLRTCKIDIADVGFMGAGYTERYVMGALYAPYKDECEGTGKWTGAPKRVLSHSAGFNALRDKKIQYFIGPRGSMVFGAQRNCELFTAVGEAFSSSEIAFVVPKNLSSTIVDRLREGTRILAEERRLESAETLAKRTACHETKDYSMTLPRLMAVFLFFLGAGVFLYGYRLIHLRTHPLPRPPFGEDELAALRSISTPTGVLKV